MIKNNDSKFGIYHHFKNINDINEYKEEIKLSTYADYENFIERMSQGEKNLLFCENVECYGLTSGTTGKHKLIPITKSGRVINCRYVVLLSKKILYDKFKDDWNYGKGTLIIDMSIDDYSKDGTPISCVTGAGMRTMKKLVPLMWTSPIEVMNMKNKETAIYLHALFALKDRNLMYVASVFISNILDFFRCIENNWRQLVDDIRKGKIDRNLDIDLKLRRKLMNGMSPSAGRAQELDRIFKEGFDNIAKKIWPNILYIVAVTGSDFSIYNREVEKYADNIPIYSSTYACTEAMIGVNPEVGEIGYVILPDTVFFEFIPIEDIDNNEPRTKYIDELTIGNEYEIVITNFSGLYRYRLGDIVKVVDYHNNSPKVQVSYRKNQLINIVAEKTTESHINDALEKTLKKLNLGMVNYTVMPDTNISPGRYLIYLELKSSCNNVDVDKLNKTLDLELCNSNKFYGKYRGANSLSRLKVNILKAGTFKEIEKFLIEKGSSKNQVKIPKVIKNKELLKFINTHLQNK